MPARIVVVLAVAAFLGLGMEFFATFRAVLSRMPIFTLAFWGLLTLAYP